VLLGHLLLAWNYIAFVCCWRALYRMITGRGGWDKTARVHELPGDPGQVRGALAADGAAPGGGPGLLAARPTAICLAGRRATSI
jgi:hypothetical protein